MRLRKSISSDIGKVFAMHRSVIGLNGTAWNEHYPAYENVVTDHETGNLYILENDSGEIIGSCAIETDNEFEDFHGWRTDDASYQEISRVIVPPERQGHGYAKEMVRLLMDELARSGCTSVRLFAAKTNLAACRTYQALGFETVGEYSAYGNDFYAMEHIIKEDTNGKDISAFQFE